MVLSVIAWYSALLNGIVCYWMVLHRIEWYCNVLLGVGLYCMALYAIEWYWKILYGFIWYRIDLHGIAWHSIVLHGTVLYCIGLCSFKWYYVILNGIVSYLILSHAISCHCMLFDGNFWNQMVLNKDSQKNEICHFNRYAKINIKKSWGPNMANLEWNRVKTQCSTEKTNKINELYIAIDFTFHDLLQVIWYLILKYREKSYNFNLYEFRLCN